VNAAELMAAAAEAPVQLTIREVLTAWRMGARTFENVGRITQDLSARGLSCVPALTEGSKDTIVQIGRQAGAAFTEGASEDEPLQLPSVAPLIKDIRSATAGVTWVSPDETLAHARGNMIGHDFSQLPVMASERDLIGYVSWRTIAEKQLTSRVLTLADVTVPVQYVVRETDTLLGQVPHINEAGFVLVRDSDSRICGIVTCADLSVRFYDLTTPFFEVGEVENRLRICIDRVFGPEELQQVARDKRVKSADDLMFKDYIALLRDDARWQRMGWDGMIDQAQFIRCLDDTRQIRNMIMHFGRELTPEDQERLKHCLRYMRVLFALP
jgi:hypothetical protein